MSRIAMKFGGTSVGSPDAITQVAQIIRDEVRRGSQVVSVVSAMSGVTNALLSSVDAALAGDKWSYLESSKDIREKHEEVINLLITPGEARDELLRSINELLDQHKELCEAINILGEATPRINDAIVSFGERMSSRLVAAVLREHGVNARAYDASEFVITNNHYQRAEPLWQQTEERIRARLLPDIEAGITPVITGFIGSTPDGVITTLGRGGSDFSGAIFAAYTDADELIIWTDVDGVMTTDPRIDKRARVLPYVSYQEVGELAFYGAKVLHPKTVQPIVSRGIPMRVRNTFNPTFEGTLIGPDVEQATTVIKAVTGIRSVSMLTISGGGMLGVPGIAGRTFLSTATADANVLLIAQASSEQSFCFVVTDDKAEYARQAVEKELAKEIANKDVEQVELRRDVVIVTAIGTGMRGTPGVAGRIFTTMGDNGINVLSIAQGSSECSISFVVAEADLERAVACLHDLALEAVPQD